MIKIGRSKKVKYLGKRKDVISDLATIVATLRKDLSEEDIMTATAIGLKTYEDFIQPKIQSFEINAKNKEDAIKQIKRLELPKKVEDVAIKEITKQLDK